MAAKPKSDAQVDKGLQSWLDDIHGYERAFKEWEARVEKILKRYRDDPRAGQKTWTTAKFNILWSNVQTLTAATFSKLPKPDVTRRFKDNDPVGRVASLILERALDYHVQHYPAYHSAMGACVLDRFLGARGTAWVRYEPHFRRTPAEPVDGLQVTEDVDEANEELDYECVAMDYVHWRDFGHSVARKWEEVTRVWRKVYMTREALVERFGDAGKRVPMDADPRQMSPDKNYGSQDSIDRATIYEGWDKDRGVAVWFSKSGREFLDEVPDPLKLAEFFPCPRPLFGTLTNDSLVPIPDFTLYQDQANELDLLADRIDGLIKALKVCGGYDASIPELQRIFTETDNGSLIPVKNWAAFAEKNGLQGALSLVDLKPIAEALLSAYQAFEQVKSQVYEITGISDIIRGQSDAQETATAQQLKGNYASLRLKTYQDAVARFATDTLRLMAQVMCKKFSAQTLVAVSSADQLSEHDKQLLQPALTLLLGEERLANPDAEEGPNPLRNFRIEVAADSLVYLDEQQEKQARVEFLTATSGFITNIAKSLQGVPPQMGAVLIPLYMELLKFGVTGFSVGKSIEGAFDEASEKLRQMASQPPPPPPPPPPDPQMEVARIKAEAEQQKAAREERKAQIDEQAKVREVALDERMMMTEAEMQERRLRREEEHDVFKLEQDRQRAILQVQTAKAMPQRTQ